MPPSTVHNPTDVGYLNRALRLARRGLGRVEPNPMVGCVIVRDGVVLGEGWHRKFGGPHAEVEALRACSVSPRGATVYVSLEPCNHLGKTPPCTDALIEAGVSRVVTPLVDPNPLVSGNGIALLRSAGVHVDVGAVREQAAELIAPYLTRVVLQRPYVIAKWAQSVDAKLAAEGGDSMWISGEASRRLVHKLRGRVDAILVGSGTVRADDPELVARDVPVRRVAVRVVFDGRLRTAPRDRLVRLAQRAPTVIFTTRERARSRTAQLLKRAGVDVVAIPTRSGRLSLRAGLRVLFGRGATNVVVEGGATLLTSFFRADLVDESWVFVAPKWVGGDATRTIGFPRARHLGEALAPAATGRWLGQDAWFRCRLHDPVRLIAPGPR